MDELVRLKSGTLCEELTVIDFKQAKCDGKCETCEESAVVIDDEGEVTM